MVELYVCYESSLSDLFRRGELFRWGELFRRQQAMCLEYVTDDASAGNFYVGMKLSAQHLVARWRVFFGLGFWVNVAVCRLGPELE
jgi:hypothetical protein